MVIDAASHYVTQVLAIRHVNNLAVSKKQRWGTIHCVLYNADINFIVIISVLY